MRKLLFAVIVAAAIVSCSKSDDETEQQAKFVCHFDDFRKSNGNPPITYGTTEDGRRCRQIEYNCLYDTIQSHGPAHISGPLIKLMTNFNYDEIIEFSSYNDAAIDPAIPTTDWKLIFNTGDRMYFDYGIEVNPTGEIKIVKTKYQCLHINN